jgi:spore coat protein A
LVKGTFGRAYLDAPTETVKYGSIQIWNIYNLTADTHPMHFHLFNVMVLRRRLFRTLSFNGIPVFTALGRGPYLGEEGWKETVKIWPGECTTVAVLVEDPMLPTKYAHNGTYIDAAGVSHTGRPQVTVNYDPALMLPPATGILPTSPRSAAFPGMPANPDEYVWHCHILEHEEHDMMRPLIATY